MHLYAGRNDHKTQPCGRISQASRGFYEVNTLTTKPQPNSSISRNVSNLFSLNQKKKHFINQISSDLRCDRSWVRLFLLFSQRGSTKSFRGMKGRHSVPGATPLPPQGDMRCAYNDPDALDFRATCRYTLSLQPR